MKRNGPTPPEAAPASRLTGRPCFVRVTGTLEQRFVAFEFALGEPEFAVELVLGFEQFRSFCAVNRATVLNTEAAAA